MSEVMLGYGIELTFNLSANIVEKIDNLTKTSDKSSGGLSIFGSLFSNGGEYFLVRINEWYADVVCFH